MTYLLWRLTARNLKVFFKEKANVFFALLAPLIVLALYVLFLGRIQIDGILASLGDGATAEAEAAVQSFCNSWMLAGALSCACITVPLCACGVMVTDKTRGITSDFFASPVPRWAPAASYFISVVLAGLAIGGAVLGICFVWLAVSGSWYLSAADVFGCIGTVILSVLSSSAFLTFIIGFIRTQGAFMGVNVIFGTVIGFLIGAYMPIGYFPLGVQYFTLFIPGSWSAGMFRNFIMRGALEEVARATSQALCGRIGRRIFHDAERVRHRAGAARHGGSARGQRGAVRGACAAGGAAQKTPIRPRGHNRTACRHKGTACGQKGKEREGRHRKMTVQNIAELVGNTPFLRLAGVERAFGAKAEIWANSNRITRRAASKTGSPFP